MDYTVRINWEMGYFQCLLENRQDAMDHAMSLIASGIFAEILIGGGVLFHDITNITVEGKGDKGIIIRITFERI